MKIKFLLNFVLVISKWRPSTCQADDEIMSEEQWVKWQDEKNLQQVHGIVDTYYGRIEGYLYNDSYGFLQQSFSNIPYAKKPIGDLRFQPPQPPENWDPYVYDAKTPVWDVEAAKRCIQFLNWSDRIGKRVIGSEDCLYLDIIRPADVELHYRYRQEVNVFESQNADVVVMLHTGTFMYDIPLSRQHMVHNLCCEYMVFVFVRYRLGPFGFMTTGDDIMPANLGMKDQIAALKFLQRIIIAFHGDPNRITLAGASAGAASVHLHMLSPRSAGLFYQAISVGGTALNPWAVSESDEKLTKIYAENLNCSTPPLVSKTEMRDCIKQKPALEIIDQLDNAFLFRNLPISAFAPSVDNDFLQAPPHVLLRGGSQRPIPWLVSFTKDEGIFPLMDWIDRDPWRRVVDNEWEELAPYLLDYYESMEYRQHVNMSRKIKEYYRGPRPSGADTKYDFTDSTEHLQQLMNMVTDRLFKAGTTEAARLHARAYKYANKAKVYLYEFAYKGEYSTAFLLAKKPTLKPKGIIRFDVDVGKGIGHIEDYLMFINSYRTAKSTLPEDKKMKDSLTWLWISFIKDHSPELVMDEGRDSENNFKLIDALHNIPDEPGFVEEVRYTKISFPGEYSYERSGFLGEKRFWRTIPTNDFYAK